MLSNLIIPPHLKRGDKVAVVSLSSGMAGDEKFRARYEIGKKQAEGYTNEFLPWEIPGNQTIKRKMKPQSGWQFIQGDQAVSGRLLGRCNPVRRKFGRWDEC